MGNNNVDIIVHCNEYDELDKDENNELKICTK